jgi:putative SOS response-associated peptidase YedK
MCGRYVLAEDPSALAQLFDCELGTEIDPHSGIPPNYNVAPTTRVPLIDSHRVMHLVRWGIVPRWSSGKSTILVNARGESVAEKATFKKAFTQSRCLIPATGYYEWKRPEKDPYFICRQGGQTLAMAGLIVESQIGDQAQPTCAIITLGATPNIGMIHDRMPATIAREAWDEWLDPRISVADALMLMTADPDLNAYAVSRKVNSIRNNEPSLIDPISRPIS